MENCEILRHGRTPKCSLVLAHLEIPSKSKGAEIHKFSKVIEYLLGSLNFEMVVNKHAICKSQ